MLASNFVSKRHNISGQRPQHLSQQMLSLSMHALNQAGSRILRFQFYTSPRAKGIQSELNEKCAGCGHKIVYQNCIAVISFIHGRNKFCYHQRPSPIAINVFVIITTELIDDVDWLVERTPLVMHEQNKKYLNSWYWEKQTMRQQAQLLNDKTRNAELG